MTTTTKTNESLRAQLRALAGKVDRLLRKDEEREAEAVRELAARAAREEVRSLRRDFDDLRGVVDDLREFPGDPTIVPRLVRRDELFKEGEDLRRERIAAVVRLHDARGAYRQADRAFERLRAELRAGGGPIPDGSFRHPEEDDLREELAKLNAERTKLWEAVEEADADVRAAEAALRPFTTVYTYGLRLDDVEIQE